MNDAIEKEAMLRDQLAGKETEPAPWIRLARFLTDNGRKAEARDLLEEALARFPGHTYISMQLNLLSISREKADAIRENTVVTPDADWERIRQGIRLTVTVLAVLLVFLIVRGVFFSGTRKLVRNEHHNASPSWSPDGDTFAFIQYFGTSPGRMTDPWGRLFLADGDGDDPHPARLGQCSRIDPARVMGVVFAPGEPRMAVIYADHDRQNVAVTDVGGTFCQEIGNASSPVWSPDGRRLVVSEDNSSAATLAAFSRRLVLYEMDSMERREIYGESASHVSWSASGDRVVFLGHEHQVESFDWDSLQDTFSRTGTDATTEQQMQEVFDLLYSRPAGRDADLYTVTVATGEVQKLTSDGNCVAAVALKQKDGIVVIVQTTQREFEIRRMNLDGSALETLYRFTGRMGRTELVCGPRGRWVAFERYYFSEDAEELAEAMDRAMYSDILGQPDLDICVARTSGGTIRRLTNIHPVKHGPVFSGSGKWIAYTTKPLGDTMEIWRTRL